MYICACKDVAEEALNRSVEVNGKNPYDNTRILVLHERPTSTSIKMNRSTRQDKYSSWMSYEIVKHLHFYA